MSLPITWNLFLILSLVSLASSQHVSGIVTDKIGQPIPFPRICLISKPAQCVLGDGGGNFVFNGSTGLRPRPRTAPPFFLSREPGRMVLKTDLRQPIRLEILDALGHRLLSTDAAESEKESRHILPRLPAGIFFSRWSDKGMRSMGKVVAVTDGKLLSGHRSPASGLAKSAYVGPRDLLVSKTGYRDRVYLPGKDSVTDAKIQLAAAGDTGVMVAERGIASGVSIDRQGGLLHLEFVRFSCILDSLVKDTSKSDFRFHVEAGTLFLWDGEYCEGSVFRGESQDIVGHWTLEAISEKLPAHLASVGCRSGLSDGGRKLKGDLQVGESQYSVAIWEERCLGNLYERELSADFPPGASVTVVSNTCMQTLVRNGAGNQSAFDYSLENDSLRVNFSFQGKTCSMVLDEREPSPINCPLPAKTSPRNAFFRCLRESGFFD